MTIEQAIKHCHEKVEEIRKANEEMPTDCKLSEELCECADEHEQLAEWLTQLKRLKDAYESDYQVDDLIQVCLDIWG